MHSKIIKLLLEDALKDKGGNQESERHTMQETEYYTGGTQRNSQDEPVQLA